MGENKTTLDTLLGFEAGMKEANDLLRPGDILPATADRPECVVVPNGAYRSIVSALRTALEEQDKADERDR